MHFGKSSWVDVVTERIQSVMVAANVLPRDMILDYLGEPDDLMQTPPGDRFAAIAPMQMPVSLPHAAGGGAATTIFEATWRVDIFTRLMEREKRTAKLMAGESRAMTQLVKNMIKALQISPLTLPTEDDTGDLQSPLIQPLRILSATFMPRRPAVGWAYCRTVWQAFFRTDFTS